MAGLISLGLSAWWLTSFVTTQKYTNSMGYTNDPVNTLHDIFTTLGWFTSGGGAAGDRWVIVLAIIALIVAFWVRDRLGMILTTLTVLSIGAFVFDPQNVIWNERLVPFWFITIHLERRLALRLRPHALGEAVARASWVASRCRSARAASASRTNRSAGAEPVDVPQPVDANRHAASDDTFVASSYRARRRTTKTTNRAGDAPRTARDGHHPHPRDCSRRCPD